MSTGEPDEGPPMVPYSEWAPQHETGHEAERGVGRDAPGDGHAHRAGPAVAIAAAWSLPFGLAMYLTAGWAADAARDHFTASWTASADPPHPPPYLLWLLAIGGTCWLVCTVAELVYAARHAGDYPPRGPWARLPVAPALRIVRRAGSGLDRRLGAGGGCLGLLALVVVGPAVVLAASVFTAAAAPLWVLVVGFATLVHLTTVV